jgi:hypothetical protein
MVKLLDKDVPTPVVVGAALAAPLVLRAGSKLLFGGAHSVVQNGRFKGQPLAQDVYDAVIVGAGPSGSTCAHFFAKARAASRRRDMRSPQTARPAFAASALTFSAFGSRGLLA